MALMGGEDQGFGMKPARESRRSGCTMERRLDEQLTTLARVILESIADGAVVIDSAGRIAYANDAGRALLKDLQLDEGVRDDLLPKLSRLGSRVTPIWIGDAKIGEIVFVPMKPLEPRADETGSSTLADRERDAIISTLSETGWKLTESARRLGISRTTLWRRLRDYGIDRDHRARWYRSS